MGAWIRKMEEVPKLPTKTKRFEPPRVMAEYFWSISVSLFTGPNQPIPPKIWILNDEQSENHLQMVKWWTIRAWWSEDVSIIYVAMALKFRGWKRRLKICGKWGANTRPCAHFPKAPLLVVTSKFRSIFWKHGLRLYLKNLIRKGLLFSLTPSTPIGHGVANLQVQVEETSAISEQCATEFDDR